jgi:hypothetical protein
MKTAAPRCSTIRVLNAIDYLEVLDDPNLFGTPAQQTLLLTCLKPVLIATRAGEYPHHRRRKHYRHHRALGRDPPDQPRSSAARADQCGSRRNWPPIWLRCPSSANIIVIRVPAPSGDFSPYTLATRQQHLAGATTDSFAVTEVLDGFDPQLAQITFSFKIDCPPYFDCAPTHAGLSRPRCPHRRQSTIWPRITAASAPFCSTE